MTTKYINLRFRFGGILVSDIGPVYIRKNKKYVFNVDTDHLPIPEVKDYCRNFGISNIDKMFVVVPNGEGLLELVKNRDLLLLSKLLANGGTLDIYICYKGEVFIKNTHVSNEFFETTCDVGGPNKHFTNKVGEGLNTYLGKEIELIDGRDQIERVQTSNPIGESTGNTNELEDSDESALSNEEEDSDEDLDEDDVEPTIHDEVDDDENIDLSGDEDVGMDLGFEDIDKIKKNLSGKLLPDEPFYDSSDQDSFDSESEGESHVNIFEILRAKKNNKRIASDPT
ncbi:hypothetical protein HAX54_025118 [Datura stramonium]|uniref:PB1-like domain-containing protein n=1 Tax=Datura stramonium TaxID=4076 RepID=A0ABS8S5Z0_DATST|nr:hypothetical protein [Datura stramonium]